MPKHTVEPWCSFCEKYQDKLIRGPVINICDECLTLCNHLLRPDVPPPKAWAERVADRKRLQRLTGVGLVLLDQPPVASARLESNDVSSCAFCRKSRYEVSKLVAGEHRRPTVGREVSAEVERNRTVYICAACVELCNEVVALDRERR